MGPLGVDTAGPSVEWGNGPGGASSPLGVLTPHPTLHWELPWVWGWLCHTLSLLSFQWPHPVPWPQRHLWLMPPLCIICLFQNQTSSWAPDYFSGYLHDIFTWMSNRHLRFFFFFRWRLLFPSTSNVSLAKEGLINSITINPGAQVQISESRLFSTFLIPHFLISEQILSTYPKSLWNLSTSHFLNPHCHLNCHGLSPAPLQCLLPGPLALALPQTLHSSKQSESFAYLNPLQPSHYTWNIIWTTLIMLTRPYISILACTTLPELIMVQWRTSPPFCYSNI